MKNINTLVEDIYGVLNTPTKLNPDVAKDFGDKLAIVLTERLRQDERQPTLRMSNLGTNCERKLWYSINKPELRTPLPPQVRMKFLFGDILEQVLLLLAKVAGHDVRGEQDKLTINGVDGHRDAVIDGVTVDTKSASTYSFVKFKQGLTNETDAFGYLDQLRGYSHCAKAAEGHEGSSSGAFLVVDKTLGNICLDQHEFDTSDVPALVEHKKAVVGSPEVPKRGYFDEPDGKSGNRKLGTVCSYCEFKHHCWSGLRTFAYSKGPVFLTRVVKPPDVPEIREQL